MKSKREQAGRIAKPETPVVIGERVRKLLEERGMSQQELAWHANLSQQKIYRVVANKQGIGACGLLRIANVLNTSLDYLVGETDDPKRRTK